MKVCILGSSGMLGSTVAKYFGQNNKYDLYTTYRDPNLKFTTDRQSVHFNVTRCPLYVLPKVDYIINCIGVIKPFMGKNLRDSIYINSCFPHELSKHCNEKGVKLIHVTTDCVYSGDKGAYDENDFHDCIDEYGKSKSLGEPLDCATIRTSIIGEEKHKFASLVSWVLTQKNQKINGYTNHVWNGITCLQFAKVVEKIIDESIDWNGVRHVFSPRAVSKYELVSLINERYNLNIDIEKFTPDASCDRSLSSVHDNMFEIPDIKQQINQMFEFHNE